MEDETSLHNRKVYSSGAFKQQPAGPRAAARAAAEARHILFQFRCKLHSM